MLVKFISLFVVVFVAIMPSNLFSKANAIMDSRSYMIHLEKFLKGGTGLDFLAFAISWLSSCKLRSNGSRKLF